MHSRRKTGYLPLFRLDTKEKLTFSQPREEDVPRITREMYNASLRYMSMTNNLSAKKSEIIKQLQNAQEKIIELEKQVEYLTPFYENLREVAAINIQRWWRTILYRPGSGLFYKKKALEFDSHKNMNNNE